MEYKRFNDTLLVRIDRGEEIIEAVRRVALAREERREAERHLAEIERNTADLAEKLDNLLMMKGG